MKKVICTFEFWFFILSLFVISLTLTGNDTYSIILIQLNPILNFLTSFFLTSKFMYSGIAIPVKGLGPNPTIPLNILITCVLTFILYGAALDAVKNYIKAKIAADKN